MVSHAHKYNQFIVTPKTIRTLLGTEKGQLLNNNAQLLTNTANIQQFMNSIPDPLDIPWVPFGPPRFPALPLDPR
jgi:hypothetical protein